MAKRFGIFCLVMAFSAGSPALAAPAVWEGGSTRLTETAACATAPGHGANFAASLFRPKLVASDPPTAFAIVDLRTATMYQVTSTSIPAPASGNYTAQGFDGRARFLKAGGFTGTYSNLKTVPATITSSTPTIVVTVAINGWQGVAGCNITFRGAYTLRLD